MLRRTKEQVVRDLPPKVEQILYCEVASRQRRLYDELRDHYCGTLLKRIEGEGLARSKIQILEALLLLRLRQAALHPGLLGLGLNLTAAQYVFLLDPWWNPAVEAQAIDRAHRIGQSNPVFAYRLIARDTIEEKVVELQSHKRDLAEAIVGADKSLIRDLRREDLEQLLS